MTKPQPKPDTFHSSAEQGAGDLIGPGDARYGVIWINPQRLSGQPCFFGTRVPVATLFDYLEGGETIDAFLDGFPPITKDQVLRVLDLASKRLGAAA